MNEIQVGRRVRHYGAHGARQGGIITAVRGVPGNRHFDVVTFFGERLEGHESSIGKPGVGRIELLDEILDHSVIEFAMAGPEADACRGVA